MNARKKFGEISNPPLEVLIIGGDQEERDTLTHAISYALKEGGIEDVVMHSTSHLSASPDTTYPSMYELIKQAKPSLFETIIVVKSDTPSQKKNREDRIVYESDITKLMIEHVNTLGHELGQLDPHNELVEVTDDYLRNHAIDNLCAFSSA